MRLRDIKAQAAKRRAQIAKLRAKGLTLEEIGDRLGISKQRVYQLLKVKP